MPRAPAATQVNSAVRAGAILLIGLAAALYLAPLLLDAPLTDPDEGLHAAIAQEMRAQQ